MRESDVLAAIRQRWSVVSRNGSSLAPRYIVATHVRGKAGFMGYGTGGRPRVFDAIVVDTWESSGLTIHAFEVKVSRSDWLRELADPSKGAAALHFADTMSVVAPAGVVKADELPIGWGWYEVTDAGTLRTKRRPAEPSLNPWPNHARGDVDRHFVVGLLRSMAKAADQ